MMTRKISTSSFIHVILNNHIQFVNWFSSRRSQAWSNQLFKWREINLFLYSVHKNSLFLMKSFALSLFLSLSLSLILPTSWMSSTFSFVFVYLFIIKECKYWRWERRARQREAQSARRLVGSRTLVWRPQHTLQGFSGRLAREDSTGHWKAP